MKRVVGIFVSVVFSLLLSMVVLASGWVKLGSNWRYQEEDGTFVVSSWKLIKTGNDYKTYYFDANGNMCTGLQSIDGAIYAFNDDGSTITNSKVDIDGEEYITRNKGLVEGIPNNYDVVSYNERVQAEKKAIEESIAIVEAEKKKIQESIANRTPAELARIAMEESIAAAEEAARIAAEEAARLERINNTITSNKNVPSSVSIEGEDGGKVTITFLVPILEGGNADVINTVLPDKIRKEVRSIYEDRYGSTTSKLTFKAKYVKVVHDLDKNLLRISFADTNRWNMFTVYMDTLTLETWSD